ncbi:MAG: hypothetical protein E7231_07040 [Cellulosilyticum sp.]|nr:hypothetical protein [Cellulosilyticum sp.]
MEKVKFVVGRSGCGKTHYCYTQIEEQLKQGGNESLMLLVPEQFNLQNQRDLAKHLAPGLLRAEVMSFNILAREVFREVGKSDVTVVEDLERMIILKRVIEAHRKEIVFYKKNLQNTGFLESMNRFITVLEQAGLSHTELQELMRDEKTGVLFESKLSDIDTIYEAFNTYLGQKFVTVEKNMTVLASRIGDSQKLANTHLWIDGFYGFTHTQLLIIRELMKKVKSLSITLPMDRVYKKSEGIRPSHPFYESILNMQKIMGICEEQQKEYEVLQVTLPDSIKETKVQELIYLEEQYLKLYAKPYPLENEAVYLRTYASRNEEVEAAARQITRLVREEGYRYHDFALIVGDVAAYRTQLESIFKEYEIPYFLDVKRNIHTNSLVAAIENVLEVLTSSYSYKSIMGLLRTYMLPISKEDIDQLENYLLAYGIKGKKKWQNPWHFEKDETKQAAINQIREAVLAPIMALEGHLESAKKSGVYHVLDLTKAMYYFLEDIGAYQTLQNLIEKSKASDNRLLELENTQMWGKVMEVFERLVDILGEEEMNLLTYRRILETSFSYIKMGVIPPAQDQVMIGSIDRTRLPRLKACFILGTNEGLIPKIEETATIFSDMDKMTLGQICENVGGPKGRLSDLLIRQPLYGAQFSIYTILTRATHKLYISAALADENGKMLRPSLVYFKLKKLFKEVVETQEDVLKNIEKPLPALGYVGSMLREYVEGRNEEGVWQDALSWFKQEEQWKERINILTDYLFYTNQQHYLQPETTKLLYGNQLKTSISQLENFRQCACCYFMRYGLKASERKLFNLDRAKVGTLFHAALEQYPKELESLGKTWTTATPEEMKLGVQKATTHAISQVSTAQRETGRFKFTASKVEKMTGRAVKALTSHLYNGAFTPEGYEISFGEGYGFPPIRINIDEERQIEIKGTIDRVDVFYKGPQEQYVKILDYKSGQKNFNLVEVYYGLQLQLLLYLDAYLEKHPEYEAGGVFYFHITNPYVSYKVGMGEEEIEASGLKQFKLSGLALDNREVIDALDKSGSGSTIPVSVNKDGSLKKGSSVATKEQFKELERHILSTIKGLGKDIMEGKVSVKPYQLNGKNPCDYCIYHTVCQFNEEMPDNCYENLDKLSRDEVWKALESQSFEEVRKAEKEGN